MDKWKKLRMMIEADISYTMNYSSDKNYEHGTSKRILGFMDQIDKQEKNEEGFLWTGIPDFDRETWKKMLENLEGLS